MATPEQTARNLADAIKRLSPTPMSDDEAAEGARNLTGFFELLIEIDREHGITSPSQCQARPCK